MHWELDGQNTAAHPGFDLFVVADSDRRFNCNLHPELKIKEIHVIIQVISYQVDNDEDDKTVETANHVL